MVFVASPDLNKTFNHFLVCNHWINATGFAPMHPLNEINFSFPNFRLVDVAVGFLQYLAQSTMSKTGFLSHFAQCCANK